MKLKVGDKIYIKQYTDKVIAVETIVRVTKTIARSDRYNFNIEYDSYIHIKGQDQWASRRAYIETPQLIRQVRRQVDLQLFDNNVFTDDDKVEVVEFLKLRKK